MENAQNFNKNSVDFAENSKRVSENILSEFEKIESDIIEFNSKKFDYETNWFGELLNYLRQNKYMSLLVICRKILKLSLIENIVQIEFESGLEKDVLSNQTYLQVLNEFFKTKNLDVKIKNNLSEESDKDKLNKLFGGKLQIKNSK